ncbi:hypothetical protein GS682_32090 [Nostoc sp. B(2019)]|nr:hypothetical protein [Nostoc sp. B(2019)]
MHISDYDQQLIDRLPSHIAALIDKYFFEIMNVADSWENPCLPDNYVANEIELYTSEDLENPIISISNGVLERYAFPKEGNNCSTSTLMFDGEFVYIEVEGKEVLNKMGNVPFPEMIINPVSLINSLFAGQGND